MEVFICADKKQTLLFLLKRQLVFRDTFSQEEFLVFSKSKDHMDLLDSNSYQRY